MVSGKRRNWVVGTVLALAGLLAWGGTALADVSVTASVDPQVAAVGDTVQLTVSISGAGMGAAPLQPTLPRLEGLAVVSTSTQQSFNVVNTRMSVSLDYVYGLQVTRAGDLVIGPVMVRVGNHTYRTQPLSVRATAGGGGQGGGPTSAAPISPATPMPSPAMPGFTPKNSADVRQFVDHTTAYVGQQVTYTFALYQANSAGSGDVVGYSEGDTPGFVTEALPRPPATTETENGRVYTVVRDQKALFATSPGKHVIGLAHLNLQLDPFSDPITLTAKPVTVDILPLPESGQPAGFTGAVGSFHVKLTADRQAVQAGDTVNLQVKISGDGNIRSVGAPKINLPSWTHLYQGRENRNLSPGGGGGGAQIMGGTAVFTYLLVPRHAGTLHVGPLEYPYFDPDLKAYRTARSDELTLTVTPGAGSAAGPALPTNGLRPLKTLPGAIVGTPFVLHSWFWPVIAAPLLVLLWAGWQWWQEARVLSHPSQARAGRAFYLAKNRLDHAAKRLAGGEEDACYRECGAALADYIADRTGAPPAGLTADQAFELLRRHGCDEELAGRARELLERTAAGRFAPGASAAGSAGEVVSRCRDLLTALERQVRAAHVRP